MKFDISNVNSLNNLLGSIIQFNSKSFLLACCRINGALKIHFNLHYCLSHQDAHCLLCIYQESYP